MTDIAFADRLQQLTVQIVPFVMAVVFHEYAHGYVAHRWGDDTAKSAGRLTFNPIPHMDPIGTVLFPLINMLSGFGILFGWARPVPINPLQFRKYRPGLFMVSLAGPAMNFILAILSAAGFCALRAWVSEDFSLYEPLLAMAYISVTLNFALGIFNLVPIPPLDGSKVIESVLPHRIAMRYESMARFGFFILIALLLLGAFKYLMAPIQIATNFTLYFMATLFQLPEVM